MLTTAQINSFNKNGFLLIPGLLSAIEAAELRTTSLKLFDKTPLAGDFPYVRPDLFLRHPEMKWLLKDPRLRSVLTSLIGDDFIFLDREASVVRTYYTGWHRDTDPPDKAGEDWVWKPDVKLVQVGWYLQEQCEEYGGGLEVVPGSHMRRDWKTADYKDSNVTVGATRKLAQVAKKAGLVDCVEGVPYVVPTRPGDLLLFHFRILHKATFPKVCKEDEIPSPKEKVLLSWGSSMKNEHFDNYMNFHLKRADKQFIKAY